MIRAAFFSLLLIENYYLTPLYTSYIPRSAWIGFLAAMVLTGPLNYLLKVMLSQCSFHGYVPNAENVMRIDMGQKHTHESAVGAECEGSNAQ